MTRVVVVGAGIVGIACALRLQKEGLDVTLVDREEPGSQCSFGNAGTLCGNAHFPSAAMLPKIPGMLLNPKEPLSIIWRDFPALLPWFWRYFSYSRPDKTAQIAAAAAELNARVYPETLDMLTSAGLSAHLRWTGRLFAYRSEQALASEASLMRLKFQAGIEMNRLSRSQALDMEPCLGPKVACAVYTPDAGHVVNPLRLSQELVAHFVSQGGSVVRDAIESMGLQDGKLTGVQGTRGAIPADHVVIAAGAWSGRLAKLLGTPVPLVAERGYHAMLDQPGMALSVPTMWVDRKIAITQMEHGIRVAGITEFGMPGSPADYSKIDLMLDAAQEIMPGINVDSYTPWQGNRPATPDYLPILGPTAKVPNAHFAFGHGHSGLMFAAITARIIADGIAKRASGLDITPYRPERFS